MTNIESFEDRDKAHDFARDYAKQHRTSTRVRQHSDAWIVQAKHRAHGPTKLQPPPKPDTPTLPPQKVSTDEQKRLFQFQVVDELLRLNDPVERERRLNQLCSQWGGRIGIARKVLRDMTGTQPDPKPLSGALRRRLRQQGIHQFEYLSAARRTAMRACQSGSIPHFASVGKHAVRGDFWVFVDTVPRHGNPVDLIEIYRKSPSKLGWWCQRLNTPTYIPTWDIELRDPMTGDILHLHRRGMNGQTVALRTLSETPNFELVDVVEADADWAEAIPYDTVEAIIADNEDEETVQGLLTY
jgi:hypothetical protein